MPATPLVPYTNRKAVSKLVIAGRYLANLTALDLATRMAGTQISDHLFDGIGQGPEVDPGSDWPDLGALSSVSRIAAVPRPGREADKFTVIGVQNEAMPQPLIMVLVHQTKEVRVGAAQGV
jgi:hypothetical protein